MGKRKSNPPKRPKNCSSCGFKRLLVEQIASIGWVCKKCLQEHQKTDSNCCSECGLNKPLVAPHPLNSAKGDVCKRCLKQIPLKQTCPVCRKPRICRRRHPTNKRMRKYICQDCHRKLRYPIVPCADCSAPGHWIRKDPANAKRVICDQCYRDKEPKMVCPDCGKPRRLIHRKNSDPEVKICGSCHNREVNPIGICPQCKRKKQILCDLDLSGQRVCGKCGTGHNFPIGTCGKCKKPKRRLPSLIFDKKLKKQIRVCQSCREKATVPKGQCPVCKRPKMPLRQLHPHRKRVVRICGDCHEDLSTPLARCAECNKKRRLRCPNPKPGGRGRICRSCSKKLRGQ